jgi:hypothetical protein
MTPSYKTYHQSSELDYSAHLQPLYKEDSFLNWMKDLWLQTQWKRPWQNWVRSLGQMWGSTLPMATQMEESTPVSLGSSKVDVLHFFFDMSLGSKVFFWETENREGQNSCL